MYTTIDCETHPITPENPVPKLVCLTVGQTIVRAPDVSAGLVRTLLASGVAGHHIPFDLAVLARHTDTWADVWAAYEADRVRDTCVRQKLVDIANGSRQWLAVEGKPKPVKTHFDLESCCNRMGIPAPNKSSPWRLRYAELEDLPVESWPPEAVWYALDDTRATAALLEAQGAVEVNGLSWGDLAADEHRQTVHAWWLSLVGIQGIATDAAQVEKLRLDTETKLEGLSATLREAGLLRPNNTRDVAATRIRAAAFGITALTEGGELSLAGDQLEECPDPALRAYGEYAAANAILRKDIPAFSAPRIRARFESIVSTGRTAVERPNLQNLARRGGIRECLCADPGYLLISADYKGQELATLAQVCLDMLGQSRLADLINSGVDPHTQMASLILGESYQWCAERLALEAVDDARQTGKVANFGFPGGLGAKALVSFAWSNYRVRLEEKFARKLKNIWLEMLPEMAQYFQRVDSLGSLIKQHRSGRWRGGCAYTVGCNTLFQGLGADCAKMAGYLYSRQAWDTWPLVNFVHDELVAQCPIADVDPCVALLRSTMTEAAQDWIPDVKVQISVKVGRNWVK